MEGCEETCHHREETLNEQGLGIVILEHLARQEEPAGRKEYDQVADDTHGVHHLTSNTRAKQPNHHGAPQQATDLDEVAHGAGNSRPYFPRHFLEIFQSLPSSRPLFTRALSRSPPRPFP